MRHVKLYPENIYQKDQKGDLQNPHIYLLLSINNKIRYRWLPVFVLHYPTWKKNLYVMKSKGTTKKN